MPEYDIALELARLHILSGADFIRQLKMLTSLSIFKPVENEKDIFAAEGRHREDFPMLLDAARNAVAHGNRVYVLPNPKGIRTADFMVLVYKGKKAIVVTRRIAENPLFLIQFQRKFAK